VLIQLGNVPTSICDKPEVKQWGKVENKSC